MSDSSLIWPILFGLLGFVEPCAIGTTLLFLITLEGRSAREKIGQVLAFTLTRTLATGFLGVGAALVGSWFLGFQKGMWVAVGVLYLVIAFLYVSGWVGVLKRSIGPGLSRLSAARGSALLGALFGLNIPACAGPLLLALLASSAAQGATGVTLARGFASLALFGFALSLPLLAIVLFPAARRAVDWVAAWADRLPIVTGMLFALLGAWSIWFGFYVSIE